MIRPLRALVGATLLGTLALSGCGAEEKTSAADAAPTAAAGDRFPVTVHHAFGDTVIEKKPERVAAVAWANHEVPLALGIVPVGMSKAAWGDDDGDGVLPWVEDKLTQLDAATPTLFDESEGIDFEAVADTHPDVILAAYSGLTQEDYDTLSKIAPVVAEPGLPWATSMADMIRLDSEALGLKAEGDALVTRLDDTITTSLDAHPSLKGKKILFSYVDPKDLSQIGFYTTHDTRPGFLAGLGLPQPSIVTERSEGSESFYETISSEKASSFDDVDVFVGYGDDTTVATLQADPLIGTIPAVKKGAVAILQDSTPLAASANPSPLSIDWGIDRYFDLLAAAADRAAA
ncbi:iron-siderophore ABC transporter substrate-binding protein [Nocardioides nematodiphilus]|uniref:iron-siderophore ABC transporter substrate-binding protein n=1 Tax=Nocardioides nematodiphilus TaxID=2849669 RepID=UPI001CD9FFB8|nr:iron-siderophore ABC transporter substrate-binding protein [Nocardioides nematodiphilus]MCA1981746.1 iron-siderophore ABC transporter substrate-binding protein [Nocardioides nematodiphilus]